MKILNKIGPNIALLDMPRMISDHLLKEEPIFTQSPFRQIL